MATDPSGSGASSQSDAEVAEKQQASDRAKQSQEPSGKPAEAAVEAESPDTDEQLSPSAWRERAGWFTVNDQRVSPHAVAGALYDVDPGALLTQAEVQRRLEKFLS